MKVAVLSDVHGNLHALDAVLDDISRHGVDATLALGDYLSGPFDPEGVADRFIELNLPSVRGNHDRYLTDGRDEDWHIDTLVRDLMQPRHFDWLRAVPPTAVFEERLFLCHGTPGNDNMSFLDGMFDGVAGLRSKEHIETEAAGIVQEVLLCGHTHVPRSVSLADGRLAVNPGSVGLPFDSGSPAARYAIVEKRRAGWNAQFLAVAYDTAAAASQALARGYPKWAEVVTTGWTKPRDL